MRTTVTLDDDIARHLREIAQRSGTSFRQTINTLLRQGLSKGAKPQAEMARFRVEARPCGFRCGVDLLRLNQLNDDLEVEEFERELAAEMRRQ